MEHNGNVAWRVKVRVSRSLKPLDSASQTVLTVSAPPFYLSSRVAAVGKVTERKSSFQSTPTTHRSITSSSLAKYSRPVCHAYFFSFRNLTFPPSLTDGAFTTIYQRPVTLVTSGITCNLKEKVSHFSSRNVYMKRK